MECAFVLGIARIIGLQVDLHGIEGMADKNTSSSWVSNRYLFDKVLFFCIVGEVNLPPRSPATKSTTIFGEKVSEVAFS